MKRHKTIIAEIGEIEGDFIPLQVSCTDCDTAIKVKMEYHPEIKDYHGTDYVKRQQCESFERLMSRPCDININKGE